MVHIMNVLAFAAFGHAVSIAGRDATQILTDLKTVDTNTNHLAGSTNTGAYQQLDSSLKTCTTHATNAGTIASGQAQAICGYVANPLTGDTKNMLSTSKLPKSELQQLRSDTSQCINAVKVGGATPTSPAMSACSSEAQNIDKLYASAIAASSQ